MDVVLERLKAAPDAIACRPGVRVMDSDGRLLPSVGIGDQVKRAISASARKAGVISGEGGVESLLAGNWLYTPSLTYRQSAGQDPVPPGHRRLPRPGVHSRHADGGRPLDMPEPMELLRRPRPVGCTGATNG
ncbi:hypothetical protein [Streptomyces sp. NPDC001139]